jgi:hypothetical protein
MIEARVIFLGMIDKQSPPKCRFLRSICKVTRTVNSFLSAVVPIARQIITINTCDAKHSPKMRVFSTGIVSGKLLKIGVIARRAAIPRGYNPLCSFRYVEN